MVESSDHALLALEYLRGKRRAEKSLTSVTTFGRVILRCTTADAAARALATHVLRSDVDYVCVARRDPETPDGASVRDFAPGLDGDVRLVLEKELDRDAAFCTTGEAERQAREDGDAVPEIAVETDPAPAGPFLAWRFRVAVVLGRPGSVLLSVGRARPAHAPFGDTERECLTDLVRRFAMTIPRVTP